MAHSIDTTTKPRGLRPGSLAAVLAMFMLMAGAGSASAATKTFTLDIVPNVVPANAEVPISATLTNTATEQQLGSANATPPDGYTLVSVAPLTPPATAKIVSGVLQLRNLSLPPGGAVTAFMRVRTPCTTGVTSHWLDNVIVKQANDFKGLPGNNLTADVANSSDSTTTSGACTPCPEDQVCSVPDVNQPAFAGPGGSTFRVTSDPNQTKKDTGSVSVSTLTALDGELKCAGYEERSTDVFRFDAPPNRTKKSTSTLPSTVRPVTVFDPLEVCYGSTGPFLTKAGTMATETTVIDGQTIYEGLLPSCAKAASRVKPPCFVEPSPLTPLTTTVLSPPGDPYRP